MRLVALRDVAGIGEASAGVEVGDETFDLLFAVGGQVDGGGFRLLVDREVRGEVPKEKVYEP